MSGLELHDLSKRFGTTEVIPGADLTVAKGEFVVFVGPSGCGKSTLLRMIAGLETASGGQILIGGRDVTATDPAKRGVAMVFQSYALFPHMTVRQNMGFGMRVNRVPRAQADKRVTDAAALLQLTPLLDRRPAQLSGGQRQRVAIGRAIVRDPQVFLFDEPLSNLDAELRVQMRGELAALHRRLGATMIYVTHDQVEAMTLADRIVVLRGGRIEQVGAPLDLYHDPDNLFVAGFLGSPRMNLLQVTVQDDGRLTGPALTGPVAAPVPGLAPGRAVTLGCRPENLQLADDGPLHMTVGAIEQLGNTAFALGQTPGGDPVTTEIRSRADIRPGSRLQLGLPVANLMVFDTATGLRIRH